MLRQMKVQTLGGRRDLVNQDRSHSMGGPDLRRCEGSPLSNLTWLPPIWLLSDQLNLSVCTLSIVMDIKLGDEKRGLFMGFQSSSDLSGGGDEPSSFRLLFSRRSQDKTAGDTELPLPLLWMVSFLSQFNSVNWSPGQQHFQLSHSLSGNSHPLYSHLSSWDNENVAWCVFPATVRMLWVACPYCFVTLGWTWEIVISANYWVKPQVLVLAEVPAEGIWGKVWFGQRIEENSLNKYNKAG